MRETPVVSEATHEIILEMSKNAFSGFDENRRPDNPQEMLKSNFYFSGLMAAEMSCSIIRAANKNLLDHYYMVDLTVTNADKDLLTEVNRVVMKDRGVITSVKGAYNISVRGKDKVRNALNFLENYPILAGDLAKNRIVLLKTALMYLDTHRAHKFQEEKIVKMEELRKKLRDLKNTGAVDQFFDPTPSDSESLGYFFSGIVDGEGSFGWKSNGLSKEPFFAVAMKDRKIIELLKEFVGHGNVRFRKDGVYHLEINSRSILKNICDLFINQFPLRHKKQRERLCALQQLLNDHTPRSLDPISREHDMV